MPERIRFEREISELGLRDYDQSFAPREAVVGERIALDLKNFLPSGADLSAVQWTIPGRAIAYYWGDRKGFDLKEITPEAKKKSDIIFYWVDGEDNRQVTAQVSYKSGGRQTDEKYIFNFNVKAPKLEYFKETKIIGPCLLPKPNKRTRKEIKEKNVSIVCRNSIEPGIAVGFQISWDWKVTLPANFGGWIKDAQTIIQGRSKIQTDPKSRKKTKMVFKNPQKTQPHEQFDQSLQDTGSDATYSAKGYFPPIVFPLKIEAGKSFANDKTEDTPTIVFEKNDESFQIDESFKYFILFKPDKPNAIWVPVAKAEWFWKIEVVRQGGEWTVKSGTKPEGKASKKGAAATEFPRYESNVSYNKWIEEP